MILPSPRSRSTRRIHSAGTRCARDKAVKLSPSERETHASRVVSRHAQPALQMILSEEEEADRALSAADQTDWRRPDQKHQVPTRSLCNTARALHKSQPTPR